jgi:hypothetical protein
VIERHDTLLKVHPLYYSKLRSELKNNNFFVCKD